MALDELSEWIATKTGETPEGEFMDWLKDGRILCKLANELSDAKVKKIKVRSKSQHKTFHALESIGIFLRWCRDDAGILQQDLFTAAQLYEDKNEKVVRRTLQALKDQQPAEKLTGIASYTQIHFTKEKKSPGRSSAVQQLSQRKSGTTVIGNDPTIEQEVVEKPSKPMSKLQEFMARNSNPTSAPSAIDEPSKDEVMEESEEELEATVEPVEPAEPQKQPSKLRNSIFSPFTKSKKEETSSDSPAGHKRKGSGGLTSKLMSYMSSAKSTPKETEKKSIEKSDEAAVMAVPASKKTDVSKFQQFVKDTPPSSPLGSSSNKKSFVEEDENVEDQSVVSDPRTSSKLNAFLNSVNSPKHQEMEKEKVIEQNTVDVEEEEEEELNDVNEENAVPTPALEPSKSKINKFSQFLQTVPSPGAAFQSNTVMEDSIIDEDSVDDTPSNPKLSFLSSVHSDTSERLFEKPPMNKSVHSNISEEIEDVPEVVLTPTPQSHDFTYEEANNDGGCASSSSPVAMPDRLSTTAGLAHPDTLSIKPLDARAQIDDFRNALSVHDTSMKATVLELQRQLACVNAEKIALEKQVNGESGETDVIKELREELQEKQVRLDAALAQASKQKEEETEFARSRLTELEKKLAEQEDLERKAQDELAKQKTKLDQLEKESEQSLAQKESEVHEMNKKLKQLKLQYSEAEKAKEALDRSMEQKNTEIQLAKDREDAARYAAQQAYAAREQAEEQIQQLQSTADQEKLTIMAEMKAQELFHEKEQKLRADMERQLKEQEERIRKEMEQDMKRREKELLARFGQQ